MEVLHRYWFSDGRKLQQWTGIIIIIVLGSDDSIVFSSSAKVFGDVSFSLLMQ